MPEQKVSRAVQECLSLINSRPDDPHGAKMEFIAKLRDDSKWTEGQVKLVELWVKHASAAGTASSNA